MKRGKATSLIDVGNVSRHGFWLLLEGREVFLRFVDFPWFRDASIRELCNVTLPRAHHLYWPDLDVDLAIESIEHPERFPLVSRASLKKRPQAARPNGSRRTRARA